MAKQQRIDPRRVTSKGRGRSGRPGGPIGRPAQKVKPATLGTWIAGARPQTLLLAIGPIALGTGAASLDPSMNNWWDHYVRASLALIVMLALQIGVNFANDYSDGVRGTDKDRVGPQRLVGSGRAKPRTVLIVALVFFGIAAVAGATLIVLTQHWWLFAVGAVALLAAWFYTGGRRPYGYLPLGELAVFLFFGIVPTVGTMFVQVGRVNIESLLGGVAMGAFAAAVLLANNLRDREKDALHRKNTLSVLVGDRFSRALLVLLLLAPFGILTFFVVFYTLAPYVFFVVLAAVPAMLIAVLAKTPRELVTVLQLTVISSAAYGVGLGAALAYTGFDF